MMKRLVLTSTVILTLCLSLSADTFYYTVLAKSGLVIRAEKDLTSPKLGVASFRSRVELLGLYKDSKVVVEGVVGFWIHARHEGVKGYLFSGYLYPGDLFDDSLRESDYIILDEKGDEYGEIANGDYQYLNYACFSEDRNWYGVIISDSVTQFEEVTIEYVISPEKIQLAHDSVNQMQHSVHKYGEPFPIEFKVIPRRKYNFFIGTNEAIRSETRSKRYQSNSSTSSTNLGRFIYPWEEIPLKHFPGYALTAKGEVGKFNYDTTQQVIQYRLFLKNLYNYRELIELTGSFFLSQGAVDVHAAYKSPLVVWSGFINDDGIPDFIFRLNIMEDKCSDPWMEVLISERIGDQVEFTLAKPNLSPESVD